MWIVVFWADTEGSFVGPFETVKEAKRWLREQGYSTAPEYQVAIRRLAKPKGGK